MYPGINNTLASPENENHQNLAHPRKGAFLTVDLTEGRVEDSVFQLLSFR